MITKLGIKDFQSIKSLAVECGPITVFVGESDSGKSAVVRALYAAAFNDYPSDHVRTGADHSTVVIAQDAGSVRVEKGKTKNSYALGRALGDEQHWDRVGRDVPEEVAEALGWRVLELDDGTKFVPSIQRQFDGPFLVGESPIRTAKILGSLTNISVLFAAIREGTNEEKRARKEGEVALSRARALEAECMGQHPHWEVAKNRADRAATLLSEAEVLVDALVVAEGIAARLEASGASVAVARAALAEAEARRFEVPDLKPVLAEVAMLKAHEQRLALTADVVVSCRENLVGAQRVQDAARAALEDFLEAMPVCPICERPMEEVHVVS